MEADDKNVECHFLSQTKYHKPRQKYKLTKYKKEEEEDCGGGYCDHHHWLLDGGAQLFLCQAEQRLVEVVAED